MRSISGPVKLALVTGLVFFAWGSASLPRAAGPTRKGKDVSARYTIPASVTAGKFRFAGETIPIRRGDVRRRIRHELNFLLLDARSVLTLWLVEKGRYQWIFEEIFEKEGIPRDFVLFAPILSGLSARSYRKLSGEGWWAIDKPCTASEGASMRKNSWSDDRKDLDLSTRCFASRLKKIREKLGTSSWITAAAAYVTSVRTIKDLGKRWQTLDYWDLPLPENAEDLIVRWIALGIIDKNRADFGIKIKGARAWTYDHVTGLILTKDLPIAEIARITGTPARKILLLNPRLKPSRPSLPAKAHGRRIRHSLAVPRGKGDRLVKELAAKGYLVKKRKR
jgi:hypothetical protein